MRDENLNCLDANFNNISDISLRVFRRRNYSYCEFSVRRFSDEFHSDFLTFLNNYSGVSIIEMIFFFPFFLFFSFSSFILRSCFNERYFNVALINKNISFQIKIPAVFNNITFSSKTSFLF